MLLKNSIRALLGFVVFAAPVGAADLNEELVKEWAGLNRIFQTPIFITIKGVRNQVNQGILESYMVFTLADYKAGGKEGADKGASDRAKTSLACEIMAAGRYATETERLGAVLDGVGKLLGNEALPCGVASLYAQMIGVSSQAFTDNAEIPLDVDLAHLGPKDFASLLLEARMQIAARTKDLKDKK